MVHRKSPRHCGSTRVRRRRWWARSTARSSRRRRYLQRVRQRHCFRSQMPNRPICPILDVENNNELYPIGGDMTGMIGVISYGLGTIIGFVLVAMLVFWFIQDITQKKHSVLRNYPVIGRLRYLLEQMGEDFRQ